MKSKQWFLVALALVVAVLQLAALPAFAEAPPHRYVLSVLGTLGGSLHNNEVATAVNERGQVVGYSTSMDGKDRHAFLYTDGKMLDLGTLGGPSSEAYGINSRGDVVGFADTAEIDVHHAFLYSKGQMIDLGSLNGPEGKSWAFDINDAGTVVGVTENHAFEYSNGQMYDLGTLGGPYSAALGINNRGDIVGESFPESTGSVVAFLYRNGFMQNLGSSVTCPGCSSGALNINSRGTAVGYMPTQVGQFVVTHPVIFKDGMIIDLGTSLIDLGVPPPDGPGASAIGQSINDQEEVVGYGQVETLSAPLYEFGFLYARGKLYDLNTLVVGSDWAVQNAWAITNSGYIVGSGVRGDITRPILLTPLH